MYRIRIAIDPQLKKRYGPEISWAWRLLLSGMGFYWQEVSLNHSTLDIAYVTNFAHANHARVCMLANLQAWENMTNYRLHSLDYFDDWSYPIYQNEDSCFPPIYIFNSALVCQRDFIFDVYWLATGQEEKYCQKNKHGHIILDKMIFSEKKALRLALASCIGFNLQNILLELGFPKPIPRWPLGKCAAACVGHDVDYPEIVKWLEPLRVLLRQGFNGFQTAIGVLKGKKKHWHFSSWIQMEKILNIRSAFYFVARQGSLFEYITGTPDPFYDIRSKHFRQLFDFLNEMNFEICLHASYFAYKSKEKFSAEKKLLEEVCGQKICGNRHHYFHLDPNDLESTLFMHEQIGLKYDTSLSHERYVGWRRGLTWPFFPFHQGKRKELKTLQIPTAWMDDHLFGYKNCNPGNRVQILRALVDKTAEQGGCLLVDVHQYVYDEDLFPGWTKTYQDLLEYVTARSDFWIDTPGRIADHWIDRYASILEASYGLTGE